MFLLFFFLMNPVFAGNLDTLVIRKTLDLNFPEAFTGAGAETVSPISAQASQFIISGKPFSEIEIELSPIGQNLELNQFSIPLKSWSASVPLQTHLGSSGNLVVQVGVTREGVGTKMPSGIYRGVHWLKARYKNGNTWCQELGHHILRVSQALRITKTSDLSFTHASPGDNEEVITPTSPQRASFEVFGEPNRTFAIEIPGPESIKLKSVNKNNSNEIMVRHFFSHPSLNGQLDHQGFAQILVGAERSSIPSHTAVGRYEAFFRVLVTYP